jgi:hypothetical protein
MDIDSIEPGEDFVAVIENTVGSCNILLAVIGQEWLTSAIDGKRRLDNPEDFVRLEIATALRREVRVVPILVQGAAMPSREDLPDDLKRLVRRNALDVDDNHWHAGVDRLLSTIEKIVEKPAATLPQVTSDEIGSFPAKTDVPPSGNPRAPSSSIPRTRSLVTKCVVGGILLAVIVAVLIYALPEARKGFAGRNASKRSETLVPRLDSIRRGITIRANRSAKPTDTLSDGRTRHLYSIWIEAPPEIIGKIAKVLYHYNHREFEKPQTESSTPDNGFLDSYNGIGAVNADMDVIVVLKDGREIPFKFNMYEAVFGPGPK